MSVTRSAARLAQAGPLSFRHATLSHARSQLCPRCFQRYAKLERPLFSNNSRRSLATAAAHRPQTLDSEPPPPRNTGVPDTSITKDDQRAATGQHSHHSDPVAASEAQSGYIVPEQDPAPPTSKAPAAGPETAKGTLASEDASTPSAKPKRRSKLRPRKAAMTLSAKAVEQLHALLEQPDPKLIRVGVKNRGCSGLAYHLEYVDKAGAFDEAVEQDGVKVLIDSKALFSIIGSEMDWIEDKLSAKFVFKNPNISKSSVLVYVEIVRILTVLPAEQCGCGESFSIS